MEIFEHADHTQRTIGIRGEDIHKWIDGLFDSESFDQMLRSGRSPGYDPYEHRKYRHCQEALEEVCREFEGKYTRDQIEMVFETHIRDDYHGYYPHRVDFENGTFTEKYHDGKDCAEVDEILNQKELADYFRGKYYPGRKKTSHALVSGFWMRIVFPTLIAMALFFGSVFAVVIPNFRTNMLERKKEMIKELTAVAGSIVAHYAELEAAGQLTREQAQKQAALEIGSMRYGEEHKDYFWITDMRPVMIMHPYRTDLIGKDLTGYHDARGGQGKRLFVEFVNIVKTQGSGYIEYMWQWKDDSTRTVPKLSYVTRVKPWDWIIGTGIYINDVQDEIDRLTHNLLIAFLAISLGLTFILLTVVLQSYRIEKERIRAESGLREAKDRYRALVDASNEGYILEVEGETIYSNHRLQRLTGYDGEELAGRKVWELLPAGCEGNEFGIRHLKLLLQGRTTPTEFEARISTRTGELVDVIISTSRIFFSEKNGHVISFRPIKRTFVKGILDGCEASGLTPDSIIDEIRGSRSVGHVIRELNRLSIVIRDKIDQGANPDILRRTISEIFNAVVRSFAEISIREAGKPPVPFAFLTLGSMARHEMTMFSDQDNALVFADVPENKKDKIQRYFLKLAYGICSKLNQAGFPYCPGGIMAVNPKWCLPLNDWKGCFTDWVKDATPESILEVNVFYDLFCVYGDTVLASKLREHAIAVAEQSPLFFGHFARNCLLYQPPVTLLGQIKTETHDGIKSVNIKDSLKPIEIFGRLYALKYRLTEPSTHDRLLQLYELGVLKKRHLDEMLYVFDYLWRIRFFNQLKSHEDLRQVNDELDLRDLTEIERNNLRNVLAGINLFQEKLSSDFLGVPLYRSLAEQA